MSQNLIDLNLSAEALDAVDAALTQLEAQLAPLIGLNVDQRRQLTKMGEKSESFCRQAVDVMEQNPNILPRNFDLEAMRRDLAAFDALRPRLVRLTRLFERANDTHMALGSDLMSNALEGYAFLKISGKGEGLEGLRRTLSARFNRARPEVAPSAPAAS
ncbi:hypothetical protein [Lysobacter capsici]|uniref:hypothetical protein n=1 Tax=Lysobacter capsici TaxID=435897 RepID=UPI001C000B5E|nr:hypothetical protein [Lysobacter capsici]QWF15167.1 hypothetical protein KME82_15315 [Lysobacter capsici]